MSRFGTDFRAHAAGRRRSLRLLTLLASCLATVALFYGLSDRKISTSNLPTHKKLTQFEQADRTNSLRGVAASTGTSSASTPWSRSSKWSLDWLHPPLPATLESKADADADENGLELDSTSSIASHVLDEEEEHKATKVTLTETAPTVMAILSRYQDDIEWLTASKAALVTDNTTTPPSTLLPIVVYQASDIADDSSANPTFPGPNSLLDPDEFNTEPRIVALVTSESFQWPAWALSWVARKNKTRLESKPGSAEDAEREQRLKLGLGPVETRPQGAKADKRNDVKGDGRNSLRRGKDKFGEKEKKIDMTSLPALQKSSVVMWPSISRLPLHIVPNRGAEAMGYLTGIIENYHNLPDFVAFMHGHRHSWHMMLPQDWQLRRLATSPPRNRSATFLPLGCHERGMMERGKIYPTNIDANYESPNGPRWHEALAARFAQAWREYLGKALGIEEIPEYVKIPSGASFLTSKEAIHRWPLEWYFDLREWLMQTLIESKWLGIVLEFSWGFIFADRAVLEFSQEDCLCSVYNM